MTTNGNGHGGTTAIAQPGATVPRARGERKAELAPVLCERVARGEMIHAVCSELGLDRTTPWRWSQDDPEFAAQYAMAREMGARALEEDAQRVADGADKLTQLYQWAIETFADQENDQNRAAMLVNVLRNGEVQLRKLRVDVLKWRAAKIAPKLYGRMAEMPEGEGGAGATMTIRVTREPLPPPKVSVPDGGRQERAVAPTPAATFAALSPDEQRAAIAQLVEQQGSEWLTRLLDVPDEEVG
jgi:hypothetical protein